jgi:Plasmid pRiA4b ORF-3-like protein
MGWEGIHLYEFRLRAAHYGSWELAASSPDVTLAALRLRKGARFIYEYDLNIPWRYEVRIEDRLEPDARKTYSVCTGGDGACPPEDIAAVRRASWTTATTGRSMRLRTWTPWSRFFSKSR